MFTEISNMFGNTPLIAVDFKYRGKEATIYAKVESYNPTGSLKDRVAYYILKKAYEKKEISKNDVIVEATSGNTGIAFSALGAYLGHKVIIFMPDWMSRERINLMKSYGAEVRLVSKEEGGFLGSIRMCEEMAERGGAFLPGQFSNPDNIETHVLYTGAEIIDALKGIGRTPDAVVAGVGTGGTVMGIGRAIKAVNPSAKAYPLEPLNSPTLSTGYKTGSHRIQGISDEFIPEIVKLDELDDIVSVDDIDSIIMAKKISERLGLGIGISSGANFIGAIKMMEQNSFDMTMTTVFADDNKKYLSTDYSLDWESKDEYISTHVELTGYRYIG